METTRDLFQTMTRRLGLLDKQCLSDKDFDLSLTQQHVLYEIERRHLPSMQEVAGGLGIDITTFSRQIQTLARKGYVTKEPHPSDRRVHVLKLTQEGAEAARKIDRQMNDYLEDVFSHLTEDERVRVLDSIRLLNDALGKSKHCCEPVWK